MAEKDGRVVIDTKLDESGIDGGIKAIQNKLSGIGESIKGVGDSFNKNLTAPLAAVGAGALKVASDFDSSFAMINNSLNITADEAEALTETTKKIWSDGFGESLEETTNALIQVKQNMKGLSGEELETATKNAMVLAKTFDSEVNEVTRAGNNLMVNFGIDSEKAFDLMAVGAKNGLNFSNEMFDNLSEYSGLFADMGYSADEYFQLLVNGAQEGVYNLDYINDVMKEFQIRIKDGSKATNDAMGQLSDDTQAVWNDFLAGNATVKEVSNAVLSELQTMDDQVVANQIGVGLYGTKWEDLESQAMYSLQTVGSELGNVDGMMGQMVETQEQTFGQRFQATLRTTATALEPLGVVLLDLAEKVLPYITKAVETVATWFSSLSTESQLFITIAGILAAAIGPVITVLGMVVGAISNLVPIVIKAWSYVSKLGAVFNSLKVVIGLLSGPVGIAVAAITLLVSAGIALYKNWDTVKVYLEKTWDFIKNAATTVFEAVANFISECWEAIKSFTMEVWNGLKDFISKLWEGIKSTAEKVWNGILSVIKGIVSPLISFLQESWNKSKENVENVFNGIKTFFDSIWGIIKNVFMGALLIILDLITGNFSDAKEHLIEIWDNIKKYFDTAWNAIKDIFKNALEIVKNTVKTYFDTVSKTISSTLETVKNFISTTWTNIRQTIANKLVEIINKVIEIFNNIKSTIDNALKQAVSFVTNGFKNMVNAIKTKVTDIYGAMKQIKGKIVDTIKNLPDELLKIGKNIVQGLINGIKSKIKAVTGVVGDLADSIKGKIEKALNIHSPSRYMRDFIAKNMILGWSGGIKSNLGIAEKATDLLADSLMPNAKTLLSNLYDNAKSVINGLPSINTPNYGYGSSSSVTNNNIKPEIKNYFTPKESTPYESAKQQRYQLQRLATEWR